VADFIPLTEGTSLLCVYVYVLTKPTFIIHLIYSCIYLFTDDPPTHLIIYLSHPSIQSITNSPSPPKNNNNNIIIIKQEPNPPPLAPNNTPTKSTHLTNSPSPQQQQNQEPNPRYRSLGKEFRLAVDVVECEDESVRCVS
jgi:hypothetical protein